MKYYNETWWWMDELNGGEIWRWVAELNGGDGWFYLFVNAIMVMVIMTIMMMLHLWSLFIHQMGGDIKNYVLLQIVYVSCNIVYEVQQWLHNNVWAQLGWVFSDSQTSLTGNGMIVDIYEENNGYASAIVCVASHLPRTHSQL